MDAFSLSKHLDDDHGVDWADTLDADEARRIHRYLHDLPPSEVRGIANLKAFDHEHRWEGNVAEPQGPMKGEDADEAE